jgi:hypothetical protein
MSHDNQPDLIRLLTSRGLSGEEAQVIAGLRAKGPAQSAAARRASEGGEWRSPAFWMAVGFLSLLAMGRVMQPAILIVAVASQGSRVFLTAGSFAAFSMFSCGAIWLLAKGKLDSVTRRLACRYRRPSRLRNDLGIALFLLLVITEAVPLLVSGLSATTLDWAFGVQLLCNLAASLLPFVLSAYAVIKFFPATNGQLACQPETDSMDVERQVERWRDRLRGREALQEEDAVELEEHLREEMAALISGGLSEHEAFLIACRRIGPQEALEHEFAVVNAAEIWRNRAYWVVVGGFSIISFGMLQKVAWEFLSPWEGTHFGMHGILSAAFWCLGFLLFLRLARRRKMPLADWLGRRHQSLSKLLADLALCGVVLALIPITANVAMFHDFQTIAFLCYDIPVLALACFGIAMLHPTRRPKIAK